MSIFNTVKQLLSGQRVELAWSDSSTVSVTNSEHSTSSGTEWESTTGRLHSPQQECRVSYDNSTISGNCTGKVGALTGSVMIGFFDNLPDWLPSLLIRITIDVAEGELTISTRESDGTAVRLDAPGVFEVNPELVNGRAWLKFEAGSIRARAISYEAVII